MERDPLRTRPEPSTEEKVQRVINAGERARQEAEHELNTGMTSAAHAIDQGVDKASKQAHTVTNKASSAIDHVTDKAHEIADQVRSTNVDEIRETLHEKQQELSTQAYAQTDAAMTATGQRMEDLADTLRQKAPEGRGHDVALKAADALERGGHYLERSTPDTVRYDLETIIRQHPIESLLVGVGTGFLLARAFRRR